MIILQLKMEYVSEEKKDQTIQVSFVELDKSIGELQSGPAIVAALATK